MFYEITKSLDNLFFPLMCFDVTNYQFWSYLHDLRYYSYEIKIQSFNIYHPASFPRYEKLYKFFVQGEYYGEASYSTDDSRLVQNGVLYIDSMFSQDDIRKMDLFEYLMDIERFDYDSAITVCNIVSCGLDLFPFELECYKRWLRITEG